MGVSNHHTATPFSNSNNNYINGTAPGAVPNRHPSISPPFNMNAPTHLLPLQNNHLGSSHTVHSGQCHGGFGPQNCAPNISPMIQNMNQSCQFQPPGQLVMNNPMNMTQNFNQNLSLPNRPFCFNNPMQNLLSMQLNHGHVVPYNAHPGNHTFGNPIQVAQSMGPQNPPIIANPSLLMHSNGIGQHVNQNQHNSTYSQAFPCNASSCHNHSLGHLNNVAQSMVPQNPAGIANPSSMVHSNNIGLCNSNHSQVIPGNAPQSLSHTLGHPNQVAQSMGPQNPAIVANPPFVMVHTTEVGQHMDQQQHKLSACQMHMNSLNQPPIFAQQLQGIMAAPPTFCTVQPQQTHNKLQLHMGRQANSINDGGANYLDSSFQNSLGKNFTRNPQRKVPPLGMQKSHSYHKQKMKGKFGFSNKNGQIGPMNGKAGKYDHANTANETIREQRRPLSLNYTEQEIQRWKEERRKNYPSKVNVEKKLKHEVTDSEVVHQDAKLRRQQLKEILAKQAELGLEVAEIPAYYLSDSENQGHKIEDDKGMSFKKGKFRNKHNKRGRRDQNDRFAKKQMMNRDLNKVKDSPNKTPLNQRKLTLLQKLLTADIKRDQIRLLQAFRFMVTNSFFVDWPEKPLKFPPVVVKETECGAEAVGDKSLLVAKEVSERSNSAVVEEYEDVDLDMKDSGSVQVEDSIGKSEDVGEIIE